MTAVTVSGASVSRTSVSALGDPARRRATRRTSRPRSRGSGRDDVRLLVSDGDDRRRARHVRRSRRVPARRRRARREHVGDDPRRDRRGAARRLADPCPLLDRAARRLLAGRGPRRPTASTTVPFADDLTGVTVDLAGGGHVDMLDRFGGLAAAVARGRPPAPGRRPSTSTRTASRSATATRPAPGRSTRTSRSSATEPGSAEMPSAARPFTPELVVDLVRRGVTIAPILLHAGVSSLEAHEMPYPERYRVPATTAAHVNAVHAAGGRVDRGRHHRGAGARDRSTTAVSCTRARAGPTSSSRPSGACARSTAWSPAGTSPRPPTCSCSRRSPGAGPSSGAYAEATHAVVTCGTSSATATCCSRSGTGPDEPATGRARAARGAARRAVRAAPAGPGDRRRHRRASST